MPRMQAQRYVWASRRIGNRAYVDKYTNTMSTAQLKVFAGCIRTGPTYICNFRGCTGAEQIYGPLPPNSQLSSALGSPFPGMHRMPMLFTARAEHLNLYGHAKGVLEAAREVERFGRLPHDVQYLLFEFLFYQPVCPTKQAAHVKKARELKLELHKKYWDESDRRMREYAARNPGKNIRFRKHPMRKESIRKRLVKPLMGPTPAGPNPYWDETQMRYWKRYEKLGKKRKAEVAGEERPAKMRKMANDDLMDTN